MEIVQKRAVVPFCIRDMYDLVNGIESYPDYLPWCTGVDVIERKTVPDEVTAHLCIGFLNQGIVIHTKNTNTAPSHIHLALIDGPFRFFEGQWHFKKRNDGSQVSFHLQYELESTLIAQMFRPIFHKIALSLVEAFVQRAHVVYGKNN